ncbi:MAG: RNA ligase (ATP) [Planctomycetes bacterium]|nr:RNA ligase (ATP) [Planctomycetota bacterium]
MSHIKVEVIALRDLRPHPNADALELATVGGWQLCVKKGAHRNGDAVVYFEAGTALPPEVADRLLVRRYLAEKTDAFGQRVLVVQRIKLRGEASFGLAVLPEPGMQLGQDVREHYGATKFFPPLRTTAGDAESDDPRFPAYTEIENLRSYPDVLQPGEEVVISEKIHGTNARVGFVAESHDGERVLRWRAGSRTVRRKEPLDAAARAQNTYWFPLALLGVEALLRELFEQGHERAVLYGEVFGPGIQAYRYGQATIGFRAFDLLVDDGFLDHDDFAATCARHGVELAPALHRGAYDLAAVRRLSEGPSLLGGPDVREGVVVKPITERTHPQIGRVILKYLGDAYLFGSAAEQDTTDQ